MRAFLGLLVTVLVLTACNSSAPSAASRSTPTPTAVPSSAVPTPAVLTFQPSAPATVVTGGCGATSIYQGGVPASLSQAGANNNPKGVPYVVADPPIAAGFIFNYPLKSGPQGDKILWVVGAPRDGNQLTINAHPLGAEQPVAQFTKPADSSPGEIYPSGLAVPSAGCWVLNLRWGTYEAEADLQYG